MHGGQSKRACIEVVSSKRIDEKKKRSLIIRVTLIDNQEVH